MYTQWHQKAVHLLHHVEESHDGVFANAADDDNDATADAERRGVNLVERFHQAYERMIKVSSRCI